MQWLMSQRMNIISVAVLLFFIIYSYNVFDKKQKINRLYLLSLKLNTLLIILEVISTLFIGKYSILTQITKALIVVIAPYLSYNLLKLICNYYPKPYKLNKSVRYTFYIVMIINFAFAIYSIFGQKSDDTIKVNELRASLLISLLFITYSAFVIFKSRKMIIQFEFISILAINIVAGVLLISQIITNETNFIWCNNSIILFFMFVIIQQRELYRDSLTGARNRVILKKCIDAYKKNPNCDLAFVMIDLDYFKSINDCYGHSEGDYALKAFVKILQIAYSDYGIVIRMGGDEFLVIINNSSAIEVNNMIKKMSRMIDSFNIKSEKPYQIKCSYACGIYNDKNITIEQFIHDIDMKMYQNKKGNRERIWSLKKM